MRIATILAAAAAATLAIPAVAATAEPQHRTTTVTKTTRVSVGPQRHNAKKRAYWRQVCTTKMRDHRRVRICKKVRAWR